MLTSGLRSADSVDWALSLSLLPAHAKNRRWRVGITTPRQKRSSSAPQGMRDTCHASRSGFERIQVTPTLLKREQAERKRQGGAWWAPHNPYPIQPRLAFGDNRSRRLAFADEAAAQTQASHDQSQRKSKFLHGTPPFGYFTPRLGFDGARQQSVRRASGASAKKAHPT